MKFGFRGSFLLICSLLMNTAFADTLPTEQTELLLAAPQVPPFVIENATPLLWEDDAHPERVDWSDYSFAVINAYFDQLNAAEDIGQFCPNYPTLTRDQQIEAWAQIFVGVSRWESNWDPVQRTYESQGIDPETNLPVYSDGLLQLSYQDIESNPYCTFNWATDKDLSSTDIHRSIFNPYNNLYCGIRTMADLITQNHRILVTQGGYWATLQLKNRNSKIKSIISELRATLPYCGPRTKGDSVLRQEFTKFANTKFSRRIVGIYRKIIAALTGANRKHVEENADPAPTPAPSGN